MAGPVYKFGGFTLDSGQFELRRDHVLLRLERKPMELLILLASRRGELISREEIATTLWDAGVFVDTEHGINTVIRKIRYVLRDDPDNPRFVQTVAGKGYRIICPVTVEDPRSAPPVTELSQHPDLPADASRQRTPRWLLPTAIVLVSLICLATALWYSHRTLPPLRVIEYSAITHDGRPKTLIGTDGSRIYFDRPFGEPLIGQISVSGGDAAPVPVPLPAAQVFDVSPDGSTLLIWSDSHGRQSLSSFQLVGGAIRHLADGKFWNAAWSPDGKHIAYVTQDDDIFVSTSDGAVEHRIALAPSHGTRPSGGSLAWSPDGNRIRFVSDAGFWEITPDGTGLRQLISVGHPSTIPCCGRWTVNGRFFVFELQEALSNPLLPGNQLWALDERRTLFRRPRSEPIQLTAGPMRWSSPVPGRDGTKIFARGVILRGELVRYDAKSHQLQPWLVGISADFVAFSPNGRSIVYVTFPEGILWKANRDGTHPVQLTGPPLYPISPRWSPDGTQVLFFAYTGGDRIQTYLVSAEGGSPKVLVPEDTEHQTDPNWSPDGQRIVYGWPKWERGNTSIVLRVLDLKTRQVLALPGSQGMWSPRWSPDGRFIAALSSSGGISVLDLATKRWSELVKGECDFPTWSAKSQFIYFMRSLDTPGVYRIHVSGGKAERVIDLSGFRSTGSVGLWMGLDPTDAPLLLQDRGSDDIYALTLSER